MYKTILVPLDGSSLAESALPLATRIAQHTHATLVLVRVVHFASEYWPAINTPYPSMIQIVVEGELKTASHYLESVAESHALLDLETRIVARYGAAAPAILATAAEYYADLIVMSSHGYSGLAHWLRGSVAEKVAHNASVPVLVVRDAPATVTIHSSDIAQPLRVLVPLDETLRARQALEPAASLLAALAVPGQQKAIHLVRVVKPAATAQPSEVAAMQRTLSQARHFLMRQAELIREGTRALTLSKESILVSWSIALDMDVANAIIRVAENGEDMEGMGVFGGCDLIAMATHGREGIQRLALGSVTERVLHATRRPLLIVRPEDPTDQKEPRLEHAGLSR